MIEIVELWDDDGDIGTGLAGYRHEDMAPMFKDAPPNCILPEEWIPYTRPNPEVEP